MNQAGRDHSRACRCIRAVISPSSAKWLSVSIGSPADSKPGSEPDSEPGSAPGSEPGRNSKRTQCRSASPPRSRTVTIRRPSAADITRGVRTPASARSASIQASSDAISGSVW